MASGGSVFHRHSVPTGFLWCRQQKTHLLAQARLPKAETRAEKRAEKRTKTRAEKGAEKVYEKRQKRGEGTEVVGVPGSCPRKRVQAGGRAPAEVGEGDAEVGEGVPGRAVSIHSELPGDPIPISTQRYLPSPVLLFRSLTNATIPIPNQRSHSDPYLGVASMHWYEVMP